MVTGRKPETRKEINSLDQKEKVNVQPVQNEKTRIQKNEERLRNLWDNFKHSKVWIIGVPEGEEEEEEVENLFENIMNNFFNPAKLSFRMEGQIKCFPDKVKLKEFIITKPLLYEMLKGLI